MGLMSFLCACVSFLCFLWLVPAPVGQSPGLQVTCGNFLTRVVIFPARAKGVSIFDRCSLRRLRAAGEGAGIHDAGGRSICGEALEFADLHDRASQL